jgi:hypothetical protein
MFEEMAFSIGDMMAEPRNVRKARVIMTFIDMLAVMAERPSPAGYGGVGSWEDPEGWQRCEEGKAELTRLSESVASDPEIARVNQLFEKYCARYERPRNPIKRRVVAPAESWPSAEPAPTR